MSRRVLTTLTTALALGLWSLVAQAGPKIDVDKGKATYAAQCLICHGEAGDGSGPAGAALNPKPTNLSTAAWWADKTDTAVMGSIRRGSPGTTMQAYNRLTREELENLVAYLRGFEPNK
mgnify:CR=1 FL=1